MPTSLYLINPGSDYPSYFGAEVYAAQGFQKAALMADLTITTIASMVPADFNVFLCDENVTSIDFDMPCDFVGITGKVTQHRRIVLIAREFRRRGKIVLIGGAYATLSPESLRPSCDILVLGEIENIADELFSDLRSSRWKEEYRGERPADFKSPVPKWSAYPNHRALSGTIQTSRGCPFECEFCDVIQYLGRKQRHKPVADVLAELDVLNSHHYRTVFLSDDNLTVYRSRAKELVAALKYWNDSHSDRRINFVTQVSIDAARDSELLRMCAEAGLRHVFIGIETPNEESLKEAKKRQNLKVDLVGEVQKFLDQGIAVTAGMIVGFDSDGPDIFERQFEFAMALPVPIFSVSALSAPPSTPLYSRLEKENRLVENRSLAPASPWNTNIAPQGMARAQLLYGIRWLCNRIYQPKVFGERMLRFIDRLGTRNDHTGDGTEVRVEQLRRIDRESLSLLGRGDSLDPEIGPMFARIRKELSQKPHAAQWAVPFLIQYMQIRHMYRRTGVWNPRMGTATTPCWDEAAEFERNVAPVLKHSTA